MVYVQKRLGFPWFYFRRVELQGCLCSWARWLTAPDVLGLHFRITPIAPRVHQAIRDEAGYLSGCVFGLRVQWPRFVCCYKGYEIWTHFSTRLDSGTRWTCLALLSHATVSSARPKEHVFGADSRAKRRPEILFSARKRRL